jgi:peptidoglycan/LPS O-acetylase OafA/YrhL
MSADYHVYLYYTRVNSSRSLPNKRLSANPQYYPELDGLRALAALMVMGFHLVQAGIHLRGPVTFGKTGVDLFFVLSGF